MSDRKRQAIPAATHPVQPPLDVGWEPRARLENCIFHYIPLTLRAMVHSQGPGICKVRIGLRYLRYPYERSACHEPKANAMTGKRKDRTIDREAKDGFPDETAFTLRV